MKLISYYSNRPQSTLQTGECYLWYDGVVWAAADHDGDKFNVIEIDPLEGGVYLVSVRCSSTFCIEEGS